MCNSKVECQVIEGIWENCFLNIRTDIWLERCSKISEIGKGKGVTMVDKKRKREDQLDVLTEISLEDENIVSNSLIINRLYQDTWGMRL
ncbi:hypothetical protein RhiirA5_436346 [Rhizophagus irregularis]|uniref:Uncharacterized protein n=1 Tax=Rhizophagus irregularis TaxID=588596 RepID=A0A2N0NM74_9GLOM|nr:hypothetical protein RhiirA5_436346 [Rhizophagus irregularis]